MKPAITYKHEPGVRTEVIHYAVCSCGWESERMLTTMCENQTRICLDTRIEVTEHLLGHLIDVAWSE